VSGGRAAIAFFLAALATGCRSGAGTFSANAATGCTATIRVTVTNNTSGTLRFERDSGTGLGFVFVDDIGVSQTKRITMLDECPGVECRVLDDGTRLEIDRFAAQDGDQKQYP
jgi:hypothetical protein